MNVNDVNNGQTNDEVEVHWTEKDLKDEVLNWNQPSALKLDSLTNPIVANHSHFRRYNYPFSDPFVMLTTQKLTLETPHQISRHRDTLSPPTVSVRRFH